MGTILRWFYDGGMRYRAYLRQADGAGADRLELVIGAGDWQAAVTVAPGTSLDDLPVQRLAEIARSLRNTQPPADLPPLSAAAGG